MKREKNPNQKAFKIVNVKKQISVAKPAEPPPPEVDTAKAVAFAMSIAQEMKQRQREADEAKKFEATVVYKNRNQQYSDADLESFRRKLLAARVEIAGKSSTIGDTIGLNSADDVEPDGGDGSTQSMRLDALSHMEKSSRTINEIDEALGRIADRTYGICMTCGSLVDRNRLVHSPFVKTCTRCQQALENEAKESR